MFYYSIGNYEYDVILMHEKEFSEEEFRSMCKESPLTEYGYYTVYNVEKHLVDNYGFKAINGLAVAYFGVDEEENDFEELEE